MDTLTAESSSGRRPKDTITPQQPCVVALESSGVLLGVLAGKHGVHPRASRLGGAGAAQEGFGEAAWGRRAWQGAGHLWLGQDRE